MRNFWQYQICNNAAKAKNTINRHKITQPLQNCIGPTIRIGREIFCLLYAGLLTSAALLQFGYCQKLRTFWGKFV